jgi:NAD(P)-dependent dehydrogenase (short-subunit alcohol dehydrogenase family)
MEGSTHMEIEPGTIALITGAGAGIGRGCAIALAAAGATVVVTDINSAGVAETTALIKQNGGQAYSYSLNITDAGQWNEVVTDVNAQYGPITVLVNNAALKSSLAPGDVGLVELNIDTWDRMFEVNVRGPMLGSRRVLPGMLAQGHGSIIMISSLSAFLATPNACTAYSPTKAAVDALMRSIAVTYGREGIRCNSIAPGVTIVDDSPAQQRREERMKGVLGRTGRPADIGGAVAFLASRSSEYVNGQVLAVDGGLSVRMAASTAPAALSWQQTTSDD